MIVGNRPGGYESALRSDDPLVTFLYILLRDHLPAGVVEKIMLEHVAHVSPGELDAFSNDWVAAYAMELTARLRGADRAHAVDGAYNALVDARIAARR